MNTEEAFRVKEARTARRSFSGEGSVHGTPEGIE